MPGKMSQSHVSFLPNVALEARVYYGVGGHLDFSFLGSL